jgi:acylphosphatase
VSLPADADARVHLWIEGRVQGVMFRQTAAQVAEELGLGGWVRNLRDGRVEVVIQGPPEDVGEMVDWCRHGPPAATVQDVEIRQEPVIRGRRMFEIRATEGYGPWS